MFAKRSDPPFGLDIGTAAVKLVALSWQGRNYRQYRVDGFAMEPLPVATVDSGNISDAAVVGEAVRRALVAVATRRKTATVAVADAAVITRTLLLDAALTATELEVEVVLEAERCIPYPIESVALDFDRVGTFAGDSALCRVLLVACPKEQVAAREEALAHAGLKAAAVEVESLAQLRAMRLGAGAGDETDADEEAAIALLDVGGSTLRLVVRAPGEASFIKHEPLPGALRERDDEPALLDAASRLLAAYAETKPASGIERLLAAGGGALRPGFAAAATRRLGLAVEPANPFAGMTNDARLDGSGLAATAPALVTACGLALRNRR